MRIGMDYRPALRDYSGIPRYVASLAPRLAAAGCDLRLYGVFWGRARPRRAPAGTRLVAWRVPRRVMDALGALGLLPADRAVGGCDLFHQTNFVPARVGRRTPQVMTVPDLAFLRDPTCHTARAAEALTRVVTRAARRCAAFLVPSEATARDCEEYLGVTRDRLHLTPLGVDPSFFAAAPAAAAPPYLLAVGTLEPRKNHLRLIRAFGRLQTDAELRIVGRRGWLCDDVEQAVARTPRVALLGQVPEPQLRSLLAGARALAYPSLLEGFGLPVLEAMAAGKPVLTSDREPLRSVAGNAALLVDPEDEEALAGGLDRLLHDPELRERLARRGPARAREFTWEACARATVEAYRAVLA
ncbi:MAG: glycosyltransferase family 4 protein [Planctomycetota bacterium]